MKKLLILLLALSANQSFATSPEDLQAIQDNLNQIEEAIKASDAILSSCSNVPSQSCEDARQERATLAEKSSDLKVKLRKAGIEVAAQEGAANCDGVDKEPMDAIAKRMFEASKASKSAFEGSGRSANFSNYTTLPGTTMFKTCQKVLKTVNSSIDQIYSGQNPSNLSNDSLIKITNTFAGGLFEDAMEDSDAFASENKLKDAICKMNKEKVLQYVSKSYEHALNNTKSCLLFYSTAGENFDSEKKYKEDDYKKPQDTHKSWDGRITCKLSGPETIDFDDCIKVLNAYNGAKVVFEGTNAVQQLQAQDFMYEQQMKLMQTDTTDLDSATVGLESQKDGLKKQENMAETRRALLIAKIALLEGLVSKMPKSEDVLDKCNKASFQNSRTLDTYSVIVSDVNSFFKTALVTSGALDVKPNDLCDQAFFSPASNHDILANQGVATTVHAIAAEAGVDVVKESVAIDQFGKQQNMIDGVINKVKGAEVVDLPEGFTTQEELMKYCELNPTAGECVGFSGFSTQVGAGNGISMNGNFGTNSDDNLAIEDSSGVNSATGEGENLTKADIPTSTVIGGIDKGAGFADATPGKAKVENAGFASPTGGGGAGGASAPGLSGGASGGQAGPAGGNSPSSSKIAYSGGSRSLSFSGGRGNSKKSSSKDGNPFSEMFGKKTAANDVLNFRDLASKGEIGGKKGNIFEQISRQYNKVDKEDKLLKYDFVDKQ